MERLPFLLLEKHTGCKPVSERLITEEPVPEWMEEATEAVHLAPSVVNGQKPLFHYDGTTVTADVANDHPMDMVDLGIAKRHFIEMAGGKFNFGNGEKYVR